MEKKQSKQIFDFDINNKSIVIIALVVFFIWSLSFFLLLLSTDVRGTFGDMFGAVNSLFSGLAFAGVIVAIILQSKELKLQREELEQTREELKGQKEQLERQANYVERQLNEATFFQFVKLLNDITTGMNYGGKEGRQCFREFYQHLKSIDFHPESHGIAPIGKGKVDNIPLYINALFNIIGDHINHYIRTIYYALSFLDNAQLSNKHIYANILKSQLSTSELLILFYAGLSSKSQNKFKDLIEKYAILEHLEVKQLLYSTHKDSYLPAAYGK